MTIRNGFLQLAMIPRTRTTSDYYQYYRYNVSVLEWNSVTMTCITLSYNMCSLLTVHRQPATYTMGNPVTDKRLMTIDLATVSGSKIAHVIELQNEELWMDCDAGDVLLYLERCN